MKEILGKQLFMKLILNTIVTLMKGVNVNRRLNYVTKISPFPFKDWFSQVDCSWIFEGKGIFCKYLLILGLTVELCLSLNHAIKVLDFAVLTFVSYQSNMLKFEITQSHA